LHDPSGFEGVMTEFSVVEASDPDAPEQVDDD